MAAAGCRTRRAARARSRAVSSWAAPLQGEWRSSDYSETGFLLQEKICFVAPRAATHLPLLVPEWRFPESLPRFPDLPALLSSTCSGLPLREVEASSSSSFWLMDSYIERDAPFNSLGGVSPRLADSAAPAAFCCALDFAGMMTPLRCVQPDWPARLPPPCRQASTRNARLRARTQRGKAAQLHTAVTGPVSHGSDARNLAASDFAAPCPRGCRFTRFRPRCAPAPGSPSPRSAR